MIPTAKAIVYVAIIEACDQLRWRLVYVLCMLIRRHVGPPFHLARNEVVKTAERKDADL